MTDEADPGPDAAGTRGSVGSWLGAVAERRPWLVLGLSQLLFLVLLAPVVYYEAFTGFSGYDDEGYVMLVVKHFIDGHTLYDEVWALYGPVYFVYKWLVHGLAGLPITHDVFRFTTSAMRLATGVAGSFAAFCLTRRVSLAATTQVLVTMYLTTVRFEPGHPQELAGLLTMMAVAIAAAISSSRGHGAIAAALGVMIGLLAMVKVNLGFFAGVAAWMALLCATRRTKPIVVLQIVSCVIVVALPALFMRRHLHTFRTFGFATTETIALLALSVVTLARSDGRGRVGDLAWYATACVATVLLVALGAMLAGSSPGALLDCTVLSPISMPGFLYRPLEGWRPWIGVIALVLAVVAVRARRKVPESVVVSAKLSFGVFTYVAAWFYAAIALASVGMPFLWLIVLPPLDGERSVRDSVARLVLCWLTALTLLQAYPVAGSQAFFGTVLLLLCAAVCLDDAIRWFGSLGVVLARPAVRVVTSALLFALVVACVWVGVDAKRFYANLTPLELPGTERIRLPAEQVKDISDLVRFIRGRADTLFSIPSFNSLYFWTGTEPPTLDTITHVMDFYSANRQMGMLDALVSAPRPMVVRCSELALAAPPESVSRRLERDFAPVAEFGCYQVLAPRRHRGKGR